MAIAYATGNVERVLSGNFAGVGLVIAESYKTKTGEERTTRYTCWFEEDPSVNIGDLITVSGALSAKVDEWTDKDGQARTTAKISLNRAKISHKEAPLATASSFSVPDDADDLPF